MLSCAGLSAAYENHHLVPAAGSRAALGDHSPFPSSAYLMDQQWHGFGASQPEKGTYLAQLLFISKTVTFPLCWSGSSLPTRADHTRPPDDKSSERAFLIEQPGPAIQIHLAPPTSPSPFAYSTRSGGTRAPLAHRRTQRCRRQLIAPHSPRGDAPHPIIRPQLTDLYAKLRQMTSAERDRYR